MAAGFLLILSAPSGAGKTTLAHLLRKELGERALFSVSYTTRAPRGQERDGVDYHFVDEAAFKAMIDRGEFLEWAQVHGHYYGTHASTLAQARAGRLVLLDIDVQGGQTVERACPDDAASVFILPPSMQELERRLRSRGTDGPEVIGKRLQAARAEIERGCATYDYLLVNDQLEAAFAQLRSIVQAEGLRRGRVDVAALGFAAG